MLEHNVLRHLPRCTNRLKKYLPGDYYRHPQARIKNGASQGKRIHENFLYRFPYENKIHTSSGYGFYMEDEYLEEIIPIRTVNPNR